MRLFLILLAAGVVAHGQKPVIYPGGVVNAASYVAGGQTGKALSPASLVSIFGSNLAATEQVASGFPLPATLGGTSVTMAGIPMPILYVSPRQINIQLSLFPVLNPPPTTGPPPIVVTTAAGSSEPVYVPGDIGGPFGIFTLDGSGCGRGAVLNVASDGSVSLNSPSNSAEPGSYISVYGTGLGAVFNPPPAGSPALSDPLSLALNWSGFSARFDFAPSFPLTPLRSPVSWAGRAPGFVGLDQVNVRVPKTVREGCGVPIMIEIGVGRSQPIPVSIRKGGGACFDPPTAGYGLMTWERTVASGTAPAGITETFTAAFPASPGKQPPPSVEPGGGASYVSETFGPSCPLPGYRNLDAGTVTIGGPGFGPVEAAPAVVDGQRVYRAMLPNGTIRPGSFTAMAGGGSDVGPFQSSLRIGSGINITSSFPPGTVVRLAATGGPLGLTVNWTGGDPDTWVTLKLINHAVVYDVYSFIQARASVGTATISTQGIPSGPGEIVLEVTPDPAQVPALSAPGLSLGGQHLWKYTYRFGGLTFQ
jgi:uncharacterized protein (TIGR03437 family)